MLSKLNSCGCNAKKIVACTCSTKTTKNYLTFSKEIDGCVKQIEKSNPAPKGIITSLVIAGVIIGGAFVIGLAAGLLSGGNRENRKTINQEITQIVETSFKTSLEQMITQCKCITQRAGNSLEINVTGGHCDINVNQNADQYISAISYLDGDLRNEFINKALIEFRNQIDARMKNVTDPLTKLAEVLTSNKEEICQKIYQEFKTSFETIFKMNIKQELGIEQAAGNKITINCRGGRGYIYAGQKILQTVVAEQTMKIISKNTANNELIKKVYNATGGDIDEFSTGFIIAIVAIIIILIALFIYFSGFNIF